MNPTLSDFPLDRLGRRIAVARRLGVSPSTITRWAVEGIPSDRILDIERETGIPRYELRPDLFLTSTGVLVFPQIEGCRQDPSSALVARLVAVRGGEVRAADFLPMGDEPSEGEVA